MKYLPHYVLAGIYMFVLVVLLNGYLSNNRASLERFLALQQFQNEALQAKAEKCAKAAANFAHIIDKRLYSEESAQRIYEKCLNE